MRRERFFRMAREEAVELIAAAPLFHLAACSDEGVPLIRALNGVVVDGALCFHAAPVGEKASAIGRPAVITVEEVVATVPSWFSDAERACPATTLYVSAQAHGVLEEVTERQDKARILQALMHKYQPEGRHVPIDAAHPRFVELYEKQLDALLVARLPLADPGAMVDGKSKLLQNRPPDERAAICQRLWERGEPGDARAVERILAANRGMPAPPFLAFTPRASATAEGAVSLSCALGPRDVPAAVALLAGQYWNTRYSPERIAAALLGSTAWVGAHDASGRLVACARAISDGCKSGWIYDVVVAPSQRGRGVGEAVMRLLLAHPCLRHCANVLLGTRDAIDFYRRFGFVPMGETADKGYRTTDMLRINPQASGSVPTR